MAGHAVSPDRLDRDERLLLLFGQRMRFDAHDVEGIERTRLLTGVLQPKRRGWSRAVKDLAQRRAVVLMSPVAEREHLGRKNRAAFAHLLDRLQPVERKTSGDLAQRLGRLDDERMRTTSAKRNFYPAPDLDGGQKLIGQLVGEEPFERPRHGDREEMRYCHFRPILSATTRSRDGSGRERCRRRSCRRQ